MIDMHGRWLPTGAACLVIAGCAASGTGQTGSSGDPTTTATGAGASGAGGQGSVASSSSAGTGAGGSGAGGLDIDAGQDGGPPGCTQASTLMYLIGQGNEFYSFDPKSLQTTLLGFLNCPLGGQVAAPFAMTLDRSGLAWVLFDNGRLFHVDITTVNCTSVNFQPGQQGMTTFGMGFVSDTMGSTAETLYATEADVFGGGTRLAKIDTTTLQLSIVGSYDTLIGAADATGNGDGKLFGFFRSLPVTVAEIDKTNAKILATGIPQVMIGSAWAFAFWGGNFWLFTAGFAPAKSKVDKFDLQSGMTMTAIADIGFRVVGAGVSTCAPVEMPF